MPESPPSKAAPHPFRQPLEEARSPRAIDVVPYAELAVTTNFSFLRGASHPEEFVERAAALGYRGVAIADRNTLAGVVRAHVAAKEVGLPLAVGARIDFAVEGDSRESATPAVLVHAATRAGYGRLSRLLTLGKRRAAKGHCILTPEDLFEHSEGLLATVVPKADALGRRATPELEAFVRRAANVFDDDRLSLAAVWDLAGDDRGEVAQLARLSRAVQVPLVAANDAHYHVPARRALQDVLVCIRERCNLDQAGLRLFPNGERYLARAERMQRRFDGAEQAVWRAAELIERAADFSLDEIEYTYPREIAEGEGTPIERLRELTRAGALERYGREPSERVRQHVEHELALIDELGYAPYFLTVADLVDFARSRGILCQGRGAAANSAVCYCLGVTAVDPERSELLFERFVSRERNEPPDIDVDFEHERREEVIQYVYAKYGRERAGMTAEVISYRARSAVRDTGKALGQTEDAIDMLAREVDRWGDDPDWGQHLKAIGFDPHDPDIERWVALASELQGFPRHLSQHVGGFVITDGLLSEIVPIENAAMADRTVIEWDKDDLDAMGMLKVDLLALGMLTCVRKALDLVEASGQLQGFERPASFDLHTIPAEDPVVYDMICAADTVGVFQIESRAQMSMLPRLRPRCFYDLVIEVSIVRPGPIQGDMVHPYLRRRNGEEPIEYPSEDVREVLERTLGVPLFQEQAMALAIVAAGFTPEESDRMRRAIAAWKRKGDELAQMGAKLIGGMRARGYTQKFAEQVFRQIQGFSSYGFPESHAASFALLVYVSCWLKCHHPAAFAAALINSQPMGFYAPAQIIADARAHGVPVRAVCVQRSRYDCTLEAPEGSASQPAIRLGLRLVRGLAQSDAELILDAIDECSAFSSIEELWKQSGVRAAALKALAYADAFASMGLDRQAALWQVRALRGRAQPELPFEAARSKAASQLPAMSSLSQVLHDYRSNGVSLRSHPMSFLREELAARRVATAAELRDSERCPNGAAVANAGIVLVRQRPGTASGITFFSLEDETGISNLIVRPAVFERYRKAARHAVAVLAEGRVERAGEVVHVLVSKIESLDARFGDLARQSRDFH